MNFFSECAKRVPFKLLIVAYIVGSAVWGVSQYKDEIDTSILEIFKMQDIRDIVDKNFKDKKPNAEAPNAEAPNAEAIVRQKAKPIAKQKLAKNTTALNLKSHFLLNNAPVLNGTASITSGVTFKLATPVAESWRTHITRNIHLYGVDTCAPRQKAKLNGQEWPCGAVTTAWLVTKTLGRNLSCKQAIMRNNIHYAQCFVQGVDLAEAGLAEGMLLISKDNKNPIPMQYLSAEETARNNKVGLWSSDFTEPLQWRRDNGSYNPFENL
ncbi:hypothetical protein V3565_04660 [Bartonella sp. B10]